MAQTSTGADGPSSSTPPSSSGCTPTPADEFVVSSAHTPVPPSSPTKRPASSMDHESPVRDRHCHSDASSDIVMVELPSPDRLSDCVHVGSDVADDATVLPDDGAAPSIDEQCRIVKESVDAAPTDGAVGYVVAASWLNRILARARDPAPSSEYCPSLLDGPVGPIDNSGIIQSDAHPVSAFPSTQDAFVPLRPGLTVGQDFFIVDEAVFQNLVDWHGVVDQAQSVTRTARNFASTAHASDIRYEIYPPVFTVRVVQSSEHNDLASQSKPAVSFAAPVLTRYHDILKHIKSVVDIPISTKIQVSVIRSAAASTSPSRHPSSPDSLSAADSSVKPSLAISQKDFDKLGKKKELVPFSDTTVSKNYNGRLSLQTAQLTSDCTLLVKLPTSVRRLISSLSSSPASSASSRTSSALALVDNSLLATSQSSSSSSSKATTTTRVKKYYPDAGLTNLGNTCYMNSALQCLRSVEELSAYFLAGKSRDEINYSNPLGCKGNVANRYSELLMGMFSSGNTFRPSSFRSTVSHYWVGMQPWQQQDTQEFLSFLTDGLHEDLNRIVDKPYIEYPDSDKFDLTDPAAITEMSRKYSDIHAARNDSVIMDLFHGFYKNTLVCPECDKISVMFDPFTSVTLQLPQSQCYVLVYVPVTGKPVKIDVEVDRSSTVKSLKAEVGRKIAGADPDAMIMADVHAHSIFHVFQDRSTLLECRIRPSDLLVMYQLDAVPSNYPPKVGHYQRPRSMLNLYNDDDDDDDDDGGEDNDKNGGDGASGSRLVYVISTIPNTGGGNSATTPVLYPVLVTLTRDEARSATTIKKKVLLKVAQFSTADIFDPAVVDGLVSTDRSGDDVVDIVMSEDADVSKSVPTAEAGVDSETVTPPPPEPVSAAAPPVSVESFMDDNVGIPPSLDQLFDIRVMRASPSIIPTDSSRFGMTEAINRAVSLADREMEVRSVPVSVVEPSQTSDSSSEEMIPSKTPSFVNPAQESSDSEDEGRSNFGPSYKSARDRAIERRGNRRIRASSRTGFGRRAAMPNRRRPLATGPKSEEDKSLLVKNGEVLVLDWNFNAFRSLFGGRADSTGKDAIERCDLIADPALEKMRQIRARRQKAGVTLDECFAETTKTEVLLQENAWYCNSCKESRRASKTLEIWTLPDVLVLHLKRFHAVGSSRHKLSLHVDFPLEGLDLNDRVGNKDGKDYTYDLIAIDNHFGDLGGGHYTAFAKSFLDGRWYDFNDSSVRPVGDVKSMITGSAYLLFYRRRSSQPLGPAYLRGLVDRMRSGEAEPDVDSNSSLTAGKSASMTSTTATAAPSPSPSSSDSGSKTRRSFFSRSPRSRSRAGGSASPPPPASSSSSSSTRELSIRNLSDRATRRILKMLSSDSEPESVSVLTPAAVAAAPRSVSASSSVVVGRASSDDDDRDYDHDAGDDVRNGMYDADDGEDVPLAIDPDTVIGTTMTTATTPLITLSAVESVDGAETMTDRVVGPVSRTPSPTPTPDGTDLADRYM